MEFDIDQKGSRLRAKFNPKYARGCPESFEETGHETKLINNQMHFFLTKLRMFADFGGDLGAHWILKQSPKTIIFFKMNIKYKKRCPGRSLEQT